MGIGRSFIALELDIPRGAYIKGILDLLETDIERYRDHNPQGLAMTKSI